MKRTFIASSIALCMGTVDTANSLSVNITQMRFNGTFNATGSLSSLGDGTVSSLDDFFGRQWSVFGQAFFSGMGAHTWAGTAPAGSYSYTFSLSANQVAWGTIFNWGFEPAIGDVDKMPVLNIMECTGFTAGSVCTGIGTPMQAGRFWGQAPAFDGTVAAVPVPAAPWLFSTGLLGLAGVARRKKVA